MSKLIIPFLDKPIVECTGDITCCCVFCLKCVVQIVHVVKIGIINTEISQLGDLSHICLVPLLSNTVSSDGLHMSLLMAAPEKCNK